MDELERLAEVMHQINAPKERSRYFDGHSSASSTPHFDMSQASSIANDASMLSVGLRKPAWPSRRESEVPARQDRDTEAASRTSRSSNRTTTTVDPQDTSSRLLMARTIQGLQDKIDEQKDTIGQQKDEIASLALDSVQHKHLIQDLERENDELKATFPPEGSRRAHNYREVGQLLEELEETRRAYETGKAEAARAKAAFEQHLAVLSDSERTLSDKLRHAHTELRECKAALAMSERKRKALKADLGELYQATQAQSEKSTRQEKEAEKYEERLVHERMQSKETLELQRELVRAHKDIDRLKDTIHDLETRNVEAREKVSELEEKVLLAKEAHAAEVQDLQEERRELFKAADEAQQQMKQEYDKGSQARHDSLVLEAKENVWREQLVNQSHQLKVQADLLLKEQDRRGDMQREFQDLQQRLIRSTVPGEEDENNTEANSIMKDLLQLNARLRDEAEEAVAVVAAAEAAVRELPEKEVSSRFSRSMLNCSDDEEHQERKPLKPSISARISIGSKRNSNGENKAPEKKPSIKGRKPTVPKVGSDKKAKKKKSSLRKCSICKGKKVTRIAAESKTEGKYKGRACCSNKAKGRSSSVPPCKPHVPKLSRKKAAKRSTGGKRKEPARRFR